MADEKGDKPIVIYIAGLDRSGSTVLAEILNSLSNFISVGELHTIWQHGYVDNWRSNDGHHFHRSPFWKRVHGILSQDPHYSPGDALSLTKSIQARRFWIPLRLTFSATELDDDERRYVATFSKLYRAIWVASGGKIIIDSGKIPYHSLLLQRGSEIDFREIHIVRDPHAIAYSRQRKKTNSNVGRRSDVLMARHSASRVSARWIVANLSLIMGRKRRANSVPVRYEQLAESPHQQVSEILRRFNIDGSADELLPLKSHRFCPEASVAFSGNSSRFSKEFSAIKLDDAWRKNLPILDRVIVSAITFPFRLFVI